MRTLGFWLKASLLPAVACCAGAYAQKPIDLPGDRFFPESVTSDGKGTAYVPSVQGGVYKVTLSSGKVEPFIKPGTFGSASVFGVLADPVHKMLWTCNNDLSGVGIAIVGADKGSSVKGFDLRSGKGKVSLALPSDGFCNDITVAKDGTLYVADSNRSQILRWKPGTALADWFFDPRLADAAHDNGGLDGIVMGPDGNLIVNNWRLNLLARVKIATDGSPGGVTIIQTSRPLEVPDGMRIIDASAASLRLAVAEGSGKVSVITIQGDRADVKTIAEGFPSAAGVTVEGKTVWHVPGLLSYIFSPQLRTQTPPLPFRLSPATLP
ncbi:MAG: hypothetical protein J7498_04245 [Sphingobium sp.]|nr:hypothetical protein [Sphingobium sp.]